jgi:hypothetical protein
VTIAADFEPELVEALNLLIEDERASVEMEVALASGATEYAERDALSRMGIEDIGVCETLRAEMERADLFVSPQINGVVFEVLGAERYDDRLLAFAHHQRIVAERASDLLESNLDGALRDTLVTVVDTHERHVTWASERASAFAATRSLEFGPRQPDSIMQTAPSAAEATQGPALPEIPPTIASGDLLQEAPTSQVETPLTPDAPDMPAASSAPEAPIIPVVPGVEDAPPATSKTASASKGARKPASRKLAARKPAARKPAESKPTIRKASTRKKPALPPEE